MGTDIIALNIIETTIVALTMIWVMWTGRFEVGVALYIAFPLWTRTVLLVTVVQTWPVLAATIIGLAVYLFRTGRPISEMVPEKSRWIIPWMLCWWLWILLILQVFSVSDKRSFHRPIFLYVILPIPLVMLFAHDIQRIRSFAVAFIATIFLGGWKTLEAVQITLDYLARDPTLSNTDIIRLGLGNYHWFSYGFSLSLIWIVWLFIQARRPWVMALLMVGAIISIYFMFMSGSRQSLNGGVFSAFVLVIWSMFQRSTPKLRTVLLTVVAVMIGITIYTVAPHLIIRDNETDVTDSFDLLGDRGGLWAKSIEIFERSPIWGTGFEYAVYSHNFFLSALADQGIVGFIFQIGYTCFFFRRCRQVWEGPGSMERASLRAAMLAVGIFTMIHSQASGNALSIFHFYWAGVILWWQGQELEIAPPKSTPIRDRVLALRNARRAVAGEATPL
jgi:O-antigen ligase